MGLKDFFHRGPSAEKQAAEASVDVSTYFKNGEYEDCNECSSCYPSSLKIDDGPLYNTAPKAYAQILVATGQTNWQHDISDHAEPWGRVCKLLSKHTDQLSALAGGPVRINGTDQDFEDLAAEDKVGIVILPHFIRIFTDPENCVQDVQNVLRVKPGDNLRSNMTALQDRSYILICSHQTRDKRCGITAPILKQALDIELREAELYRDPDEDEEGGVRVVKCNHVGGHKYAANVLIYQNNGMALMLGRIRPEHARDIVSKTIKNNIVPTEHVRFCNKVEAYEW